MLSRRELIGGGAGVMHLRSAAPAAAGQREPSPPDYSGELRSIREILSGMRNEVATPTVVQIRDRQRQFFRINQRFPECVDLGLRQWERMQDWHIEHGRVLTIQRAGDGRWQMDFIMSVLVLKHELPENEVGQAYDR
jgi:hypothetical protein